MMNKELMTTEKSLLKKLWEFSNEMVIVQAASQMSKLFVPDPNPEDTLKKIDDARKIIKKIRNYYHPDYLSEQTADEMCAQLEAIARKIYIGYASCKRTKLTNLFLDDLCQWTAEASNLVHSFLADNGLIKKYHFDSLFEGKN